MSEMENIQAVTYANVRTWGFNDARQGLPPDPDMMRRADNGDDIGEIYMAGYDAGDRVVASTLIPEEGDDEG